MLEPSSLPDQTVVENLVRRAWEEHHRVAFLSWSIPQGKLTISTPEGRTVLEFAFRGRWTEGVGGGELRESLAVTTPGNLGGGFLILGSSARQSWAQSYSPADRSLHRSGIRRGFWEIGSYRASEIPPVFRRLLKPARETGS